LDRTQSALQPGVQLETYQPGLIRTLYCSQAQFSERYASDPAYTPKGESIRCRHARQPCAGNISYLYWSFQTNKFCLEANAHWRETANFTPRQIKGAEAVTLGPEQAPARCGAGRALGDERFLPTGRPVPHARLHARA